jgi:molybdopterin molybdotransferase
MRGKEEGIERGARGEARLRGFSGRASLEEATGWIDAQGARLRAEEIGVSEAAGRVLAAPVDAAGTIPPADRAGADGYAVRAGDTVGAGDYNPLTLALSELEDELPPVGAAPIVAGARLPRGADAILPFELARANGTTLADNAALPAAGAGAGNAVLPAAGAGATLDVFGAVAEGWGIERKGQQVQAGTRLAESGRVLLPQDIGLLASLGIAQVQVAGRPRVRILVSEPKSCGECGGRGDANGPMLRALVERDGGSVVEARVLEGGGRGVLAQALEVGRHGFAAGYPATDAAPAAGAGGYAAKDAAPAAGAGGYAAKDAAPAAGAGGADLTLVAGRSGAGWDDDAALAIAEAGELAIHGIALRPGGSAGLGLVGGTPVLLLPGDPLACQCAYDMLAGRLIRRLGGRGPELPYAVEEAEVGRKIVSAIGVVDLCRVRLDNGKIEPIGSAESGGVASAVRADGFVVVPAPLEGYAPGTRVSVYVYGRQRRDEIAPGTLTQDFGSGHGQGTLRRGWQAQKT